MVLCLLVPSCLPMCPQREKKGLEAGLSFLSDELSLGMN